MSPEDEYVLGSSLLIPPKAWPWEWSPEGDAITWRDGGTVVMREELALIIERLAPTGVPRIGPLVLLLAACRGMITEENFVSDLSDAAAHMQLAALAEMPRELVAGIPAKTSLASLVFAAAPKMAPRGVSAVLSVLRGGLHRSAWSPVVGYHRQRNFLQEMRLLREGLAPLDAEKIQHALRTGIPEAPRAAEVELPLDGCIHALLREMENDEEFHALARLVRDVMAAVILPRALPQPHHDSPGGFADIGNRGELHRLLLSELAHDDDTLAARVALGEALYLRREPSANPPAATLALLLDSGLRMWGTPRVFGAAVALACLAKAPPHQGALAFRASGSEPVPLALSTRAGLTAHLAALDTALNPAAALPPLAAKLRTADSQLDVIVITHPLALADPDFNAACASQRETSIHAATVDRDGAFALHLRTAGGWQPLAAARLKLAALFAAQSRRAVPRETGQLPAMLRRERCLFFLPIPQKLKAVCAAPPDGMDDPELPLDFPGPCDCVGIAEDGSVWEWYSFQKWGAVRLASARLSGELCALFFDGETQCVIALGHESRGGRLNLIRKFCGMKDAQTQVTELPMPVEKPIRMWAHGGHLFLGTERQVHVLSIATGTVVAATMLVSGTAWLNGRFVTRAGPARAELQAVTFDGTRVVFEPIAGGWLRLNVEKVAHVIPRPEGEVMCILDRDGRFLDASNGRREFDTQLGPLSDIRASTDGQRFLVCDRSGQHRLINLPLKQILPAHAADSRLNPVAVPNPWTLRTKFTHVAADCSGRIWLRARRGYWAAICLHKQSRTFALHQIRQEELPHAPVKFGEPEEIPEHGCSVSCAELRGGGRAWLDSRGMLHLQSASPVLPEITIVLAETSSLPVWCSDGAIVGPEYFLGYRRSRPGDADKIDGHLRAFVASCQ